MEPMKLDSLAIAAASNLAEASICGACELSDMEPKKVIVPGMERERVVIASANADLHKQPKKKSATVLGASGLALSWNLTRPRWRIVKRRAETNYEKSELTQIL